MLCCSVPCRDVLCCAMLLCARSPLSRLLWAQAILRIGLNAFLTPSLCLQKLTSVTCLTTSATCTTLQPTQISHAPAPPFMQFASAQHHSWQRQCCCCAEPPQGTPIHLTLRLFFIQCQNALVLVVFVCCAERRRVSAASQAFFNQLPKGMIVLCLFVQSGGGCQQPARPASCLRGRRGR